MFEGGGRESNPILKDLLSSDELLGPLKVEPPRYLSDVASLC